MRFFPLLDNLAPDLTGGELVPDFFSVCNDVRQRPADCENHSKDQEDEA